MPGVRAALRRLRQARAQALEGARPRRRPLLSGARPRQGQLPGARRAHRARPLGEVRLEQVRLGLRGLGRVARAAHVCRSALAELARVDWHTVGGICARVEASLEEADGRGRLDGLRRIGVDETSYKKGQRYMTVVVDHDRGRVVWACRGHGKDRLNEFLDLLTDEQREAIEVVTADGARWIADAVAERLPRAELAVDPFHAVSWATEALC